MTYLACCGIIALFKIRSIPMDITYIKAGILFGLMIVLPILYIMHHEGVFGSKKESIKKVSKDGECIDFFDELLHYMSGIVGSKLDYASSSSVRGLAFKNLTHKQDLNGKQLDCESVQIRFMLKIYPKGVRHIFASVESSYGSPRWDGKEMHYNYPINTEYFECDVNEFQTMWNTIVEKLYVIDVSVDETTERVRDGVMSYWTEKKYGHVL